MITSRGLVDKKTFLSYFAFKLTKFLKFDFAFSLVCQSRNRFHLFFLTPFNIICQHDTWCWVCSYLVTIPLLQTLPFYYRSEKIDSGVYLLLVAPLDSINCIDISCFLPKYDKNIYIFSNHLTQMLFFSLFLKHIMCSKNTNNGHETKWFSPTLLKLV